MATLSRSLPSPLREVMHRARILLLRRADGRRPGAMLAGCQAPRHHGPTRPASHTRFTPEFDESDSLLHLSSRKLLSYETSLQPGLPSDDRGQRDRHPAAARARRHAVPASTLQTATLAGIADLFAVVVGTPDDLPG